MPLVPIERPSGFTRCYGCGVDNARGLALEFFRDSNSDGNGDGRGDAVTATFVPDAAHGGYGRLLHGGVTATIIDEAFGWALYALLGKIGITTTFSVELSAPLRTGEPLTVRGTIERSDDRFAQLKAVLVDARGTVAATGLGTMRFVSVRAIERIGGFAT